MTLKPVCCRLCEQVIMDFDPRFHEMPVDNTHTVTICTDCVKAFAVWHQEKLAALFPSALAKKRFPKK